MALPNSPTNSKLSKMGLVGLQKLHGSPKRILDCKRFLPDTIAHSGLDYNGGYLDFIRNDALKPVSKDLEQIPEDLKVYQNHYKNLKGSNLEGDVDKIKEKWALNSYKKCTSPGNLPKTQQFVDYKYPSITKDPTKVEAYKNTYLKTDNIAIKYPTSETEKSGNCSPIISNKTNNL